MEQINVQEAATAGLQSVENLIRLLSTQQSKFNDMTSSSALTATPATDYIAVADVAVNKFKKFISLLDRNRTGHARFRRGPAPIKQNKTPLFSPAPVPILALEKEKEKVYSPAPIQQRMPPVSLVKSGSFDRKDFPVTTINFAASKGNSFISSLTGDSESLQPSMSSSGFQITNMSQVSMSGGQSNMSNSSFKRKCNSMDDSHTK
nr:probable WRKY transcription factor 7 [Tanacetum cinerariifolium]